MLYIGIDIGGTNIEIGWVTQDGQIIRHVRHKTEEFDHAQEFVEQLVEDIDSSGISTSEIGGIGIGAPNGNYFDGSIENAPNLKWEDNVPLAKIINHCTGLPVTLTNDANAVAHGELQFGYGKKYSHFAVITLGTGLGSGIVVDGKVLYGKHGVAGEFGHVNVYPGGRRCTCGRNGCLETYVSRRGIKQTYLEKGGKEELEPHLIAELARKGDKTARETFDYTSRILGLKLADLVHLFDTEAIILYGGIAKSHDLIIPVAKEEMEKELMSNFKNRVEILPSTMLDGKAGILGAAAVAMYKN